MGNVQHPKGMLDLLPILGAANLDYRVDGVLNGFLDPLTTHIMAQQHCFHGTALLDEVEQNVIAVDVLAHRKEGALGSARLADELREPLLRSIPDGSKVVP